MKPLAALALAGGAAALAYLIYRQMQPATAAPAAAPAPQPGVVPIPFPAPSTSKPQPPMRRDVPGRPPRPSDSDPRMVAAIAKYEAEKRASTGYFFKSRPYWIWSGGRWAIGYAV